MPHFMLDKITRLIQKLDARFGINTSLLLILVMVTQHSFAIKFASIFLALILGIGSFKKFDRKAIPLFYLLIIITEILKFAFFNPSYSVPHAAQFAVGMVYWISALALCWLIYYHVKESGNVKGSLQVIAVLNFAFSLWQIVHICFIEGVWNPYNTGHRHPYGVSSGDLINGLFHGVHLTNAFVSLMLCFYFMYHKQVVFLLLCLGSLLLTGNNYATLVLGLGSFIMFFTAPDKGRRMQILMAFVITVGFYFLITPLNAEYMIEKVAHVSATLPNSSKVQQEEEASSKSDFVEVAIADTLNPYDTQESAVVRVRAGSDSAYNFVSQSGKARSYFMTRKLLFSSPGHFLFGTGMGGFSSKLAFNSSGVMEGSSLGKVLPRYETAEFKKNHKSLYVFLKHQHIMFHSESNRPFSVYNQLLGEYGFVGFIFFLVFYLWFFIRRMNWRTYALPVLISLLFVFNIDYLFEGLSVVLFFETLMFADWHERTT